MYFCLYRTSIESPSYASKNWSNLLKRGKWIYLTTVIQKKIFLISSAYFRLNKIHQFSAFSYAISTILMGKIWLFYHPVKVAIYLPRMKFTTVFLKQTFLILIITLQSVILFESNNVHYYERTTSDFLFDF